MTLAHPEWSVALLSGFLLTVVAVAIAGRRALQRRRLLLGEGSEPRAMVRSADALLLLALLGIALALLGPQIGTRTVRVPAAGVDAVLLIDVSRSMDARDVAPSRLDRARRAAAELLADLSPGDRAALAVFAGRGVLLTPLTPDTLALQEMLPALDSELLAQQGSRLDAGIEAAVAAFSQRSARPRAVVIFSDGEDATGGATGAAIAATADARVITVALGTEGGSVVPDSEGPLRDVRGRIVTSRRDRGRLQAVAQASRGTALVADPFGVVPRHELRDSVRREAALTADGWSEREVALTRVTPLALGALLLLALELALPLRRRAALPALGLIVLPLLLIGAGSGENRLGAESGVDAAGLLALGVERADRGDTREAERAFFGAVARAPDRATAAEAYFDLGVMALARDDTTQAIADFFDALALDPDDREARFNLEWSLRRAAQQPPAPAPIPPPPDPAQESEDQDGSAETPTPQADAESTADPTRTEPRREPDPDDPAPRPVPALSPGEAARWLETVRDDPTRALRSALREDGRARGPRREPPAW